LLDTTVTTRVPQDARKSPRNPARDQTRPLGTPSLRRDLGEDFAPRRRSVAPISNTMHPDEDDYTPPVGRTGFGGLRLRLRGGIPRSIIGRCLAGFAILAALGASLAGMWELRSLLLANPRLVIGSSSDIQITGNNHLSRAQLLTVFGGDVDRNILTVPLAQRRAERKPVAFVRQGSAIGLVDAHGVLLDMAADEEAPVQPHYSFPVVTGISARDPLSVRAARMKVFTRFTTDLGEQAKNISEVDLSSPEDVKALIPDGTSDILVHFGEDNFLHRYDLYRKNLPGWRKDFPKLASADMRYERQVVLEMQPGASVPVGDAATPDAPTTAPKPVPAKPIAKATPKAAAKPAAKALAKPAVAKAKVVPAAAVVSPQHLHTAFDVPSKATLAKAKSTKAGTQ